MLDWNTILPYAFIAAFLLICIGIYTMIAAKKFLKIVFGLEFLLLAANIILLSFGSSNLSGEIYVDAFAQTLSIIIIIIGGLLAIIGFAIEKKLLQISNTSEIEFTFSSVEFIEGSISSQNNEEQHLIQEKVYNDE